VSQLVAATTEGVRISRHEPGVLAERLEDLEAVLAALAVEGRALEPPGCSRSRSFSIRSRSRARDSPRERSLPALKTIAENCGSFKSQTGEVRSRSIRPAR
jgi:hypothetical protein